MVVLCVVFCLFFVCLGVLQDKPWHLMVSLLSMTIRFSLLCMDKFSLQRSKHLFQETLSSS